MKIKFNNEIGGFFPPLKYAVLLFGTLSGLAFVSWLIYCIASPHHEAVEISMMVFAANVLAMIISLFCFYTDNCRSDRRFESLVSHLFKTFCLVPVPLLMLAVLIEYTSFIVTIGVIGAAVSIIFGKVLYNLEQRWKRKNGIQH